MWIVTNISQLDEVKCREFVFHHPDGNIFQSPEGLKLFQSSVNYEPIIISAVEEDKIIGSLLAVIIKEGHGLKGYLSRRCIIWGGPIIAEGRDDALSAILEKYNEISARKIISTEFRNFQIQSEERKNTFEEYGFTYKTHLNITIDLSVSETALWKNVKKQRKDGINKAKKAGFKFNATNGANIIPIFYELLQTSYNRIRLPYPKMELFLGMPDVLPRDSYKFFSLSKDNVPVVILCALFYNKNMYAFYLGSTQDVDILKMRSIDYLYWEVIRWAKENDFKMYDWMGAGSPDKEYGVRKFKLEYGGKITEPGRYYKIHNTLLMDFAKLGLWLIKRTKKRI